MRSTSFTPLVRGHIPNTFCTVRWVTAEGCLARNGNTNQNTIPIFQTDFSGTYPVTQYGRDGYLLLPGITYSRLHHSEILPWDSATNSSTSPDTSGIFEKNLLLAGIPPSTHLQSNSSTENTTNSSQARHTGSSASLQKPKASHSTSCIKRVRIKKINKCYTWNKQLTLTLRCPIIVCLWRSWRHTNKLKFSD